VANTNQLHIEELRSILEVEQDREISLTEASEIGLSLIDFFEVLAKKVCLDVDEWLGISKESEGS